MTISTTQIHFQIITSSNTIDYSVMHDNIIFYSTLFILSFLWTFINFFRWGGLVYLRNYYNYKINTLFDLYNFCPFILVLFLLPNCCDNIFFTNHTLIEINPYNNLEVIALSIPVKVTEYSAEVFSETPVRIYDNLGDSETLKQIRLENRKKAGIYRLTNKINGKIYIGSSANLYNRLSAYLTPSGLARTERIIIQAILKYGLINFRLEILEYVSLEEGGVEFLLEREQFYFDLLNPQYNILKNANSSKGAKWSEEAKAKLRAIRKVGKDSPFFGKKHTEESKLLMTLSNKKTQPIFCYIKNESAKSVGNTPDNLTATELKFVKQFNSFREASKELNINYSSIHYALTKGTFFKNKYFFTLELLDLK